jgi:uncharacterized repeat protein (TIGR03803 family)
MNFQRPTRGNTQKRLPKMISRLVEEVEGQSGIGRLPALAGCATQQERFWAFSAIMLRFKAKTRVAATAAICLIFSALTVHGASALKTLYSFPPSNGGTPMGVTQGSDGSLYGVASISGGQISVLYGFTGGLDGAFPNGALVEGADGNFYGTTAVGGAFKQGTIFRVTPAGQQEVHQIAPHAGQLWPLQRIVYSSRSQPWRSLKDPFGSPSTTGYWTTIGGAVLGIDGLPRSFFEIVHLSQIDAENCQQLPTLRAS